MSEMDWSGDWHGAFRIELRAAAIGFASRGWPVFPGTQVTAPSATDAGPMPAHENWRELMGAHPHRIAAWWTAQPYSLLVATGLIVDAVEVDDRVGQRAARLLRAAGRPAPIVAMPNGRWLFLTATGDRFAAELAGREDITWHGKGSWIPLPPTPFAKGVVHWRVKPEVWGWRLPSAEVIHGVLARAVESGPVEKVTNAHSGTTSTAEIVPVNDTASVPAASLNVSLA